LILETKYHIIIWFVVKSSVFFLSKKKTTDFYGHGVSQTSDSNII